MLLPDILLQVLQEAEDAGLYLETPAWNALLMCAGEFRAAAVMRHMPAQQCLMMQHQVLHKRVCNRSSAAYLSAKS